MTRKFAPGYGMTEVLGRMFEWPCLEMDDCDRIQRVISENLTDGHVPTLGFCRALWESYDASWLILPEEDDELWEDLAHIFTPGWHGTFHKIGDKTWPVSHAGRLYLDWRSRQAEVGSMRLMTYEVWLDLSQACQKALDDPILDALKWVKESTTSRTRFAWGSSWPSPLFA